MLSLKGDFVKKAPQNARFLYFYKFVLEAHPHDEEMKISTFEVLILQLWILFTSICFHEVQIKIKVMHASALVVSIEGFFWIY